MKLTFIYRDGCSLCDAMWDEWTEYRRRSRWGRRLPNPERLDVADDPELERRYGALVPVLSLDGQEICHYFFDEEAVERCLSGGANPV